jgi:biotin synthase-like enzyme
MSIIKPLKICRVCGKNYCVSGYCSFCRDKDSTAATIKSREIMDRKAVKTTTVSAEPAGNVTVFPTINGYEVLQPGAVVTIVTDGSYETCPHCGSLILKATVEQKIGGD